MPREPARGRTGAAAPERASRKRQRQRLIDACIAALHRHGPSRTTVEKVVALAQMSPGIVRFYFDSKDAMLVASLAYLATEFEERVMVPVGRLRDEPVRALEHLVELYFDPEIASPRKVSVWYSFWGEASSRQEYHEICGKKDEEFAALVHDLIGRVIVQSGATHLDSDAIALGLIGVLEVLWQTIAFQNESDIDRAAARARSLAYLRSVFPGEFGATAPPRAADAVRLPASAYADAALFAAERERLIRPAWQLVGHEAEVARAGDFLAVDLAAARVLVVRDEHGRLHAFRNACPQRPHALVSERRGHLPGELHCAIHHLRYRLDGRRADEATTLALAPLALRLSEPLIFVRDPDAGPAAHPDVPAERALPRGLAPAEVQELEVQADWKVLVEQWLERSPEHGRFLPPNQLLIVSAHRATILQILPVAAGRCRLRCYAYAPARARASPPAHRRREAAGELQQQIELAESIQAGLAAGGADAAVALPSSAPLAAFHACIASLLPRR